jgi:hypothetical protein
MASSVNTSMHDAREFFWFAHLGGLIPGGPSVYARIRGLGTGYAQTCGCPCETLI